MVSILYQTKCAKMTTNSTVSRQQSCAQEKFSSEVNLSTLHGQSSDDSCIACVSYAKYMHMMSLKQRSTETKRTTYATPCAIQNSTKYGGTYLVKLTNQTILHTSIVMQLTQDVNWATLLLLQKTMSL